MSRFISKNVLLPIIRRINPSIKDITINKITEAGNINLMYRITTNIPDLSYILRGAPKKFNSSKLAKEVYLHKLVLEKTNVPVPNILLYDDTRKKLPFSFVIMEFMPGSIARFSLKKIRTKQKLQFYYDLGMQVAKLHSIKFKAYGRFYGSRISRIENRYEKPFIAWKDFYEASLQMSLGYLTKSINFRYGSFTKKSMMTLVPQIKNHVNKNMHLIQSKSRPSFIHDDLNLSNILVQKSKVSAILDFEMVRSAVPENELAVLPFMWMKQKPQQLTPEGTSFLEGYYSICKRKYDLVQYRIVYAPVELFKELCFDFYYQIKFHDAKRVVKNYEYTINYFLNYKK